MNNDAIWLFFLVMTAWAAYGIGYRRGKRDAENKHG